MKSKDSKEIHPNYGLYFSGLVSIYWAYKELTYKGSADYIFHLKSMIKHPSSLQAQNEGKLVYVTGSLRPTTMSSLQDDLFKISVPGLKLKRSVEMFQFFKAPDSYQLKWSDKPISSSGFLAGFENPKWKIFESEFSYKGDLMVGDYQIAGSALKYINSWREVVGQYKGSDFKQTEQEGKLVLYKSKKQFVRPKLGNYRIGHKYIPSGLYVSVIGQQKSGKIVPYKDMFLVKEGLVDCDKMVEEYGNKQVSSIWATRILCPLGIIAGIYVGSKI